MPKIKYRFSLTQEERVELEAIVAKGKHNSQKVINVSAVTSKCLLPEHLKLFSFLLLFFF